MSSLDHITNCRRNVHVHHERKVTEVTTSARLNCDGFVTNEDKESRCVSGLSGLRDKERTLTDYDRLKSCLFIQNKKTTPTYKNYIIHSIEF